MLPVDRFSKAATRFLFATSIIFLAACRLQVSSDVEGKVYTNLGADCTRHCSFPINVGEELDRELEAISEPSTEFVRWQDSLGDVFSICANPTQELCPLRISGIVPEYEGYDVRLRARFQQVNGYNVNFVRVGTGVSGGYFRRVNLDYWEEKRGSLTFTYRVVDRLQEGLQLLDEELGRNYLLSLAAGQFGELSDAGQSFITAIVGVTAKPLGWTVTRVDFGDPTGLRKGAFVMQEDGSWLLDYDSERVSDIVLSERERTQAYVRLAADLTAVASDSSASELSLGEQGSTETTEYIINLESGAITSQQSISDQSLIGFVHDARQPVNGWDASRVEFSDPETGEVLGYFERTSQRYWEQFTPEGDSIARLLQLERSAKRVALVDEPASRSVNLDFSINMVAEGPTLNAFPTPAWNITEAR